MFLFCPGFEVIIMSMSFKMDSQLHDHHQDEGHEQDEDNMLMENVHDGGGEDDTVTLTPKGEFNLHHHHGHHNDVGDMDDDDDPMSMSILMQPNVIYTTNQQDDNEDEQHEQEQV